MGKRMWSVALSFAPVFANTGRAFRFEKRRLAVLFLALATLPLQAFGQQSAIWKSTKFQLEAVVNQQTEWDLRKYFTDPKITLPSLSSTNLPKGFKLENRKVGGQDTVFLVGSTATLGTFKPFHVIADDKNKPGIAQFVLTVVATATNLPLNGGGGTYPRFTERPVNLPGARAGEQYATSIAPYVTDADPGDKLKFEWVSGAKWLNVKEDGSIESAGVVPLNMVGTNGIRVRVTDSFGLKAEVNAYVEVQAANEPPRWQFNGEELTQITLKDAERGKAMADDVSRFAMDPDNELLTFSVVDKKKAPWFSIRADGLVNGTATETNSTLGDYNVVLRVTDGNDEAFVIARGRVTPPNNAPTFTDPIKISVKERSTFSETLVGTYVKDADAGDTLTFQLKKPAPQASFDWVNLTAAGELTLSPRHEHVNKTFDLPFTVTDGKAVVAGTLQVSVLRDPLPPQWTKPLPYEFQVAAGQQFNESLLGYAKDFEGLDVTYEMTITEGNRWVLIDEGPNKPRLHGRPDEGDVGETKGVLIAKNDFAQSSARPFTIRVVSGNRAPVWKADNGKITLRSAMPDVMYGEDLYLPKDPDKSKVSDSDPEDTEKLRFTFRHMDPKNTWAFVNGRGKVFGIPDSTQNAGTIELEVTAVDTRGASASTIVRVPLKAGNEAPSWNIGPDSLVDLGRIKPGETLTVDLTQKVTDPDDTAASLKFRKITGPSWMNLSASGSQLVMNPPAGTALRDYTAIFTVSDAQSEPVEGGLKVTVANQGGGQNRAPEFKQSPVSVSGKAGRATSISLNQASVVVDPDAGDTLTFGWTTGAQLPSWLSLSPEGVLAITSQSVAGTYERGIRVTDSKGLSAVEVLKLVLTPGGGTDPDPGATRPPIWLNGDIADGVTLRPGEQVNIELPGNEVQNDPRSNPGLGLYFGKAPTCNLSWVTVTREGALTIAPLATIKGEFTCDIIASNDPTFGTQGRPFNRDRDAVGLLRVTVKENITHTNQHVVRLADQPSRKVPVEILFVIDNPSVNGQSIHKKYFTDLKLAIHDFLPYLSKWNIDYRIAVISARDFSGKPVLSLHNRNYIMRPNHVENWAELQARFDLSRSDSREVSPMFSIGALNDKLKNLSGIDGKEFLVSRVPLFVYIVSHDPDRFDQVYGRFYSGQVPSIKSAVTQLFDKMSVERKKPMMVFVENHNCLGNSSAAAQEYSLDMFRAVSKYNFAIQMIPEQCDPSKIMSPWLKDFGPVVAAQAYRFDKRAFGAQRLSEADRRNMRIFIEQANQKSIELVGNTGEPNDQWIIANDSNGEPTLYIQWWNIRVPYDSETDKLVIRY